MHGAVCVGSFKKRGRRMSFSTFSSSALRTGRLCDQVDFAIRSSLIRLTLRSGRLCDHVDLAIRSTLRSGRPCDQVNLAIRSTLRSGRPCDQVDQATRSTLRSGRPCDQDDMAIRSTLRSGRPRPKIKRKCCSKSLVETSDATAVGQMRETTWAQWPVWGR